MIFPAGNFQITIDTEAFTTIKNITAQYYSATSKLGATMFTKDMSVKLNTDLNNILSDVFNSAVYIEYNKDWNDDGYQYGNSSIIHSKNRSIIIVSVTISKIGIDRTFASDSKRIAFWFDDSDNLYERMSSIMDKCVHVVNTL